MCFTKRRYEENELLAFGSGENRENILMKLYMLLQMNVVVSVILSCKISKRNSVAGVFFIHIYISSALCVFSPGNIMGRFMTSYSCCCSA